MKAWCLDGNTNADEFALGGSQPAESSSRTPMPLCGNMFKQGCV
jgi:hypothetical protein